MVLLRTLIFTVVVPGSVVALVPYRIIGATGARLLDDAGGLELLALASMTIGAAIYLWSALAFAFVGRGTPAPIDPPRLFVSRGPYRFTRNPMYVGVELVLLGEALLLRSFALLVYAFGVWVCFHLFVVLYEEPGLTRRFGQSYEAYRRAVPRWVPRLPRRAR